MSASQVIDCGSVPVPWKTLKLPEKNTVNEAVFEMELFEISAEKTPGFLANRNLRKIRRL